MRNGFLVLCAALAAFTVGCSSSDTHVADVAAIKDTEAAWLKDAQTKDVDKWVAHYTEDASVLIPNAPLLTGKDAISGGIKPMLSDPNFALTFASSKVDVAKSGDLGYTQGTYSMTTTNPATKASYEEKGKYLTVYRKQTDGTWKSVEDTFMADAPPPPPPPPSAAKGKAKGKRKR